MQNLPARSMNSDRLYHLRLILPIVVLIALFIGYAGITLIQLSLQKVSTFDIHGGKFIGFGNYLAVAQDWANWAALKNSLIWIIGTVAATTLLGIAVGLFLSRDSLIIRITRNFMLVPWVLPGVVAAATWKWMYQTNNGIINMMLVDWNIVPFGIPWLGQTSTALPAVMAVMTWRIFPLFALVVASAVKSLDPSLFEAARIDGARSWQMTRYITLPGIKHQIVTMALLTTIWVANNLVFVHVMTGGGPLNSSETLPVRIYDLAFTSNDIGLSSVVSIVNAAIIAVIGVIYIRLLRSRTEV